MILAHPNYVRKSENGNILVRKDAPVKGKVGLVSGGGSGHEPSHGGFVGYGMLDAAVCGEVFTSPTPDQVYEAIKEVIEEYYRESKKDEYLFKSQKGGHIVENTAYRLLKSEFKKCRFKYNTGTHSMRKSHGKEINEIYGIEMAQTVLGHDNQRDTLRYIGMEKEMVDKAILSLNI